MIKIPKTVLSQLNSIVAKIQDGMKKPSLNEVGGIFVAGRRVPVFVNPRSRSKTVAGQYFADQDKIVINRLTKSKKTCLKYLGVAETVERISFKLILCHEVAHAIDRKRILTAAKNRTSPGKKGKAYYHNPIEFDAFMAQIEYVLIPYMAIAFSWDEANRKEIVSKVMGADFRRYILNDKTLGKEASRRIKVVRLPCEESLKFVHKLMKNKSKWKDLSAVEREIGRKHVLIVKKFSADT